MTAKPNAQAQFLKVVSREEAIMRFDAALADLRPKTEIQSLAALLGKVLAQDIKAISNVPPFDRALVDGFAVRASDVSAAGPNTPVTLNLTGEDIACGTAPRLSVTPQKASLIATGGPIPRGADAVIMVEHSLPLGKDAISVLRPALPGQFIGWAGSDMAEGETVLRQGTQIGAREIGMLAAAGISEAEVVKAPRVAVLSTGDELIAPGAKLGPAQIHDANGPMIAAAVCENGGDGLFLGALPDNEAALEAAMRNALAEHDMLILSGGTSKGAGDMTHRIVAGLGKPGIVVHGVALKPGKPLCLAVCDGKPVVILPGFPTSAMFTFHDIIAPLIRRMSGLPKREDHEIEAEIPARLPSELGRTEFAMVSLVPNATGLSAYPSGKGSGAITSFAQADGFVRIEALADHLPAGTKAKVRLFNANLRVPDLVILGSHCMGLDIIANAMTRQGFVLRMIALGSLGGLQALTRVQCDLAPIHLLDPQTGIFNRPFLAPDQDLITGWRRMQGIVFRKNDPRFAGQDRDGVRELILQEPDCIMVGRNQGAGTRILLDQFLGTHRPNGYFNQPRSHHAVAAAVAQGRADWGVTIAPLAKANNLGFLPLAEEHYDFACRIESVEKPALTAFKACLQDPEIAQSLQQAGFTLAPQT